MYSGENAVGHLSSIYVSNVHNTHTHTGAYIHRRHKHKFGRCSSRKYVCCRPEQCKPTVCAPHTHKTSMGHRGTSMWSIHLGFWFNFVLHIRMWPSGDDIQEVPFHPLAEFATHRLFCVFRRNSLFNIIHWQFLNWISHCAIPTFSAVEQKIKRRIDNAQANTFAAKFNSHTKMQCEKLVHPRTLCVYV